MALGGCLKNTIDLNLYRFLEACFMIQQSQAKVCHTLDISRATFNRHLADCRDLLPMGCLLRQREIMLRLLFHHSVDVGGEEPLEQLEQAQQISQSFEGNGCQYQYVFHAANPLSTLLFIPLLQRAM
ncbi:hypothetical protein O9929_15055 [Vibrio lentus]|nr:hypothetical protein [Vibrio lentus]